MKKTLLSALKHGSGTIFILLAMMLGVSLQAWGWSYQTKESSWSSCSSTFESVSFYATPDAATTTSLDVKVEEPSNAITAFKVWQNDCKDQYMGVSFSSMKCVFRISAKWTSSNMYNTYTVVIPQGKIYITPSGGSAIEMTKGDSFVYTAYVTFPTETYTFSITGDDVSATIEGSYPSGHPSSVRLNYTDLSSDYKYAKITYNLKTNQVSVSPLRYFAAGEYIYFVNGSGYPYSGGTSNDNWIYSNGSDKIGYADIILKDTGDAEHTYRFSYYSGTEYGSGAVYRAQITTACVCKSFVVTRGNTVGGDSEWNKTGDLTYNSTNVAYNTITKTASSGTSWTGNYTSYCNAPVPTTGSASSITTTTVTLGATVAAAASDPCTPTYVGVKVYSDASCETLVTSGQTAFVNYATTYSINITSLTPKTTYYYKAYAVSDAGTTEATISRNFTTDCLSDVNKETVSGSTSQNVCLGDATAISVSPSGALTYTYQWYYNNTDSEDGAVAIPGATSESYTPAVVGANYYFCAVGATGGYCDVNSNVVGAITVKAKPTLSVSQSSVTNYVPVTVTAKGAEVATWSVNKPSGNSYLYKKNSTSAVFKASVGSRSNETYTITGTTSESCSGTATVTVTSDSDNCQ